MQKKSAVNQCPAPLAVLRVTGKFSSINRKIAGSFDGHLSAAQSCEQFAVAFQDNAVGAGQIAEPFFVFMVEDQGIVQTTRALQHSAAAGATPQHANTVSGAGGVIDLRADLVRISGDNEILARLPHS